MVDAAGFSEIFGPGSGFSEEEIDTIINYAVSFTNKTGEPALIKKNRWEMFIEKPEKPVIRKKVFNELSAIHPDGNSKIHVVSGFLELLIRVKWIDGRPDEVAPYSFFAVMKTTKILADNPVTGERAGSLKIEKIFKDVAYSANINRVTFSSAECEQHFARAKKRLW